MSITEHLATNLLALTLGVLAVLPAWWVANRQRAYWQTKALTDELTGLGNRRQVLAVMRRLLDRAVPVTVMLIDLDGFKCVNDAYGHGAGDDLLRAVAVRLQLVDHPDLHTVARLGGDEYVLVATSNDPDTARGLAEAAHTALAHPAVSLGWNRWATVRASIGVAIGAPGARPRLLLHQADRAMYEAKRAGGGVRMYTGSDPATMQARPPVRQRDRRHQPDATHAASDQL
ncbi:hypothetical protein GCM10010124_40570 [Pilimelia terevasa]|uniref:GGDEF domain-containing protein n=1 Tax=Pilimelia terevasa TaxID=53372 RepID=A0A8J3BV62_9ACTN|nr:GGDEF domain-containing protein [Pilimelia terevasa]GGK43687.1 hypothetical protein GCM10010124_40570 [Pilimelia terevasa]